MTTPTIFSDVAGNANVYKYRENGVIAQKFSLTLPVSTAADTNCGLVRFVAGATFLGLVLDPSDMDTATTLQFDIGYLYDNTTGEDDNALADNSTIGQTGATLVLPVSGGLTPFFTATDDGYLSITTRGEAIEVTGTITGYALFSYDA
jgi:hypothetical protein